MKYRIYPGTLEIIMEAQDGITDLNMLFDRLCLSRKDRYLYLQEGRITLNRIPARQTDTALAGSDRVRFHLIPEHLDRTPASEPCEVIYSDDLIYVVHKEPGMIIHDDSEDCLAARAAAWQQLQGLDVPVRYIHRLDRETSGLVLFSKVPLLQGWYDNALRNRKIRRTYLAISRGSMPAGQHLHFADAIGKDRHVNGRYRVSPSGKLAATDVICLEKKGPFRLLECALETGRTHQIRVHLSAHGMPIVNDPLYGIPEPGFRHMGLWACRLQTGNPFNAETITVTDRIPEDFRQFKAAAQLEAT